MKLTVTIAVSVILYTSTFAEIVYTKRANNYLREGPGAFFKLVEVLPINEKLEIIEKEASWMKVKTSKKYIGWLAENSISNTAASDDIVSELSKTWSSKSASKSGIAAAIKGLKGKSDSDIEGETDTLLALLNFDITRTEWSQFYDEIKDVNSSNKNVLRLSDLDMETPEYDPDLAEQQIGFGVASKLAASGVVKNKQLNKYLNLIAQSLVANSSFYDWEFNVLLLDSRNHDGYACPGGYIFITSGALISCRDEAELASIIAHEMAHVIRRHGLQEMTKRETHIKVDEAFRELDAETGDTDEVVNELEKIMVSSYERIVHKRLLDYEIEADKIASVLCANAGYDPFALSEVTRRLSGMYQQTDDIFDNDYLSKNNMASRSEIISQFITEEFSRQNAGARVDERFVKHKNLLKK